ncbi:hypothetical protein V2J09_007806 [Rumex salicifolius]
MEPEEKEEMAAEEVKGDAEKPQFRQVLLISAGASHSVALLSGGTVCSWGRGEDGQLGIGDAEDRLSPIQVSALDDHQVTSLICGADHTMAYSDSQMQVYSWGWGDFGRLGHGNSSDLFLPHPIKALGGVKIRQIASGDSHCLAVTMEGQVASWGRNQNGQLGLGTTEDSLVPQKLHSFDGIPVKMVAAGAEHSAAVTEDGHLYGWGWGRYGNLGLGDRKDRLFPEKVLNADDQKMILVACGWRHTISVNTSGKLYTYGWSKYGQLGHGDNEDHLIPHRLEKLSNQCVSQISGGWRHTMAVTSDGTLYAWGWNKFGQLGVGDNVDRCAPVQLSNFDATTCTLCKKVTQICCGWRHTLAVTDKCNMYSWGRGTNGQLGHGDSRDRNQPTIIEALSIDGSSGQQIESSSIDPSSGKNRIPPIYRYAIVPDENIQGRNPFDVDSGDASVPENDGKRIRMC